MVLGFQLPSDQQPLQRFQPDARADGDHRLMDDTGNTIEALRPGMLTTVQDWAGPSRVLAYRCPAVRTDGRPVLPGSATGSSATRRVPPGWNAPEADPRCASSRVDAVCVTGAAVAVTLDGVAVPQMAGHHRARRGRTRCRA